MNAIVASMNIITSQLLQVYHEDFIVSTIYSKLTLTARCITSQTTTIIHVFSYPNLLNLMNSIVHIKTTYTTIQPICGNQI